MLQSRSPEPAKQISGFNLHGVVMLYLYALLFALGTQTQIGVMVGQTPYPDLKTCQASIPAFADRTRATLAMKQVQADMGQAKCASQEEIEKAIEALNAGQPT